MKSEILKVKFNVKYQFYTELQKYAAKIKIILPLDDNEIDSSIHKAFRNETKTLLDEHLWYNWGSPVGEYSDVEDGSEEYVIIGRFRETEFKSDNLEELKEKVQNYIEECKKIIIEIVDENIKKIEEIPSEYNEELDLLFLIIK